MIDPLGDVYKCWEEIGDTDYRVGNIQSGLHFSDSMRRWIDYDFLDSRKCSKCSVLPLCKGGCPKKALDGKERHCASSKYNVESMIELLHKAKTREEIPMNR